MATSITGDTLTVGNSVVRSSDNFDTAGLGAVRPMFTAYGGPLQDGDVREVMAFNTALTNVGGGYDTSTYTFTAPIAGYYNFSMSCMTYGDQHERAQFCLNGVPVANQIFAESSPYSVYPRLTYEIVIEMAVGDTMRVDRNMQNSSTSQTHGDYRHFTGIFMGGN